MSGHTSRVWWLVYALVVVINLFDAVSTHILISEGYAEELNPIMDYIIQNWGWTWFFAVKVLIVIPLAFLVPHISLSGKILLSILLGGLLLLTIWHITFRFILISTS